MESKDGSLEWASQKKRATRGYKDIEATNFTQIL
jgi:hypothetical protein